jgi:hypothetical protein
MLAVNYCRAIRTVAGLLTRDHAQAAGSSQAYTEKREREIRRTAERFIVRKTSLQATSGFFYEIESRFTLQNQRQARTVFCEGVSKIAKSRLPIAQSEREVKERNRKLQRAQALFSEGRPRSLQKLRQLFLQAQSLRTSVEEQLAYARARYGQASRFRAPKISSEENEPPKILRQCQSDSQTIGMPVSEIRA